MILDTGYGYFYKDGKAMGTESLAGRFLGCDRRHLYLRRRKKQNTTQHPTTDTSPFLPSLSAGFFSALMSVMGHF